MSNLPNDEGLWEFVIKRTPTGAGTAELFENTPIGTVLKVDGPFGLAYLRRSTTRDIVCIGGGAGLSPLLSILRSTVEYPEFKQRAIHFFYGARTPSDNCLEHFWGSNEKLSERIQPVVSVSEATATDWTGQQGYIHESLERWLSECEEPNAFDYYFCGPSPMTTAVQSSLMRARIPTDQIFYDRFI